MTRYMHMALTFGTEIAFYGSNNCDTSGQVIVLDDNGCVDYSGLDAMSYVIETP